jgi:glycosyltransferase involved in cell wall biosynthesis
MRGAGVELDVFRATAEPAGTPIVAFAGRLLWPKGVGEFANAARALKGRGVKARFVLIGEPDGDNPDSVQPAQLKEWEANGVVELWGKREDMPAVLPSVHVVCLPSVYGEGVPKILLEAAACGRPVVTTDWPGCRDAVRSGETGLLVPPGDSEGLQAALERLVADPELRKTLGQAARRLAEKEFDVKAIITATLAVYHESIA